MVKKILFLLFSIQSFDAVTLQSLWVTSLVSTVTIFTLSLGSLVAQGSLGTLLPLGSLKSPGSMVSLDSQSLGSLGSQSSLCHYFCMSERTHILRRLYFIYHNFGHKGVFRFLSPLLKTCSSFVYVSSKLQIYHHYLSSVHDRCLGYTVDNILCFLTSSFQTRQLLEDLLHDNESIIIYLFISTTFSKAFNF